ncbi:hypothetical protein QYM36_003516, partial [Artemia franciscana]
IHVYLEKFLQDTTSATMSNQPQKDVWENDLEHHIRQCPCTCNHLGYGNYWDYEVGSSTAKLQDARRTTGEYNQSSSLRISSNDHHSLFQIQNGQLNVVENGETISVDNASTTSREEQAGFMSDRSTVEQIFTIRQIVEKTTEFRKTGFIAYVDFRAAFDSVDRKALWRILELTGLP